MAEKKQYEEVSGIKMADNGIPKMLFVVIYVLIFWAVMYAVFAPGKLVVDSSTTLQENKGQLIFEGTCLSCHATGAAPQLNGVTNRMKEQDIKNVIKNGRNTMPAIGHLFSEEEIDQVYKFLETYK